MWKELEARQKPAATRKRKSTYVSLYGLENSKTCNEITEKAVIILKDFGEKAVFRRTCKIPC